MIAGLCFLSCACIVLTPDGKLRTESQYLPSFFFVWLSKIVRPHRAASQLDSYWNDKFSTRDLMMTDPIGNGNLLLLLLLLRINFDMTCVYFL
jgi:hypothetical protein